MQRRTKIVASIGPTSDDPSILRTLVRTGMDMARVSLAHSSLEETLARIGRIQEAAADEEKFVGILADLPGPKVRAAPFPDEGTLLLQGSRMDVVPGTATDQSTDERLVVEYPNVLAELEEGDPIVLGDGAVQLVVESVGGDRAVAEVSTGGWAQGRPGVALPARRLSLSSPTETDLRLLEALVQADVDAVAISFVRSAADVVRARDAAGERGPMLVAKIETQEAVDALESIIGSADGVMVARGDLGIRCALEDVPHYQKRIIQLGVRYGRPVITATQMLESMVRESTPTRAEVSDVANAVFDGTSALMLSGETAVGHDPVNAVRTMARIAVRAEREFDYVGWGRNLGRLQSSDTHGAPAPVRITAAVSAAAWRASVDADVAAIIACTNTGATARAISRFRPTVPVLGVTPSTRTARQLSVAWGITPLLVDWHGTTDDIVWFAVKTAAERGLVAAGDLVAVLVGSPTHAVPVTNILRLEPIE